MSLFWIFSCRSLHSLVLPTKNSLACSFCVRLLCALRTKSIFPDSVLVFSFRFPFLLARARSLSFSGGKCLKLHFSWLSGLSMNLSPSVRFMLHRWQMKRCHIGQKVALLTVFLMTVASLKATCEYFRQIPSLFIACRCRCRSRCRKSR